MIGHCVDVLAGKPEVGEEIRATTIKSRPAGRKMIAQRFPGSPIRAVVARIGVVERWVRRHFMIEPLQGRHRLCLGDNRVGLGS